MDIETAVQRFKKVRATNGTATSFASKVPTKTEPTGAGVIDMVKSAAGGKSPNGLLLIFYGTGSDTNTMKARAIGWRQVGFDDANTALWIPVLLGEFSATLSTPAGVAGATIVATELFADTITVDEGNSGVSIDAVSPANDTIAHVSIDAKGFQKVEVVLHNNSSATDVNALYAKY